MRQTTLLLAAALGIAAPAALADTIEVGVRPYWLIDRLAPGALRDELDACRGMEMRRTNFSIGHRGAPMQFPEHTRESYVAAFLQGAGILECDVTFTKDRQLVCRHAQCDLHTTTNILATPLAEKCSVPFTPASGDQPASARCCTSDITLEEFRTLHGKMDAADTTAITVEGYMDGTAGWRTDLYASSGTLMTLAEAAALFEEMGVGHTPELKTPEVEMPFDGDYTQEMYAQQLIDELKAAGVAPERAWPQSFQLEDVLYWLEAAPEFGAQAVYLDDRDATDDGFDPMKPDTWDKSMAELAAAGVKIIAPPMWMLVTTDASGAVVPSVYAEEAKAAGLGIITWTLERSGPLASGGGWYYQSIKDATDDDGDMLVLLDVLARQVGVLGVFSDWPATTTYYASCTGLN